MQRPWMPFYVGDYRSDTGHLSTVQHGAYILLILHYWAKGGLPDDDQELANITRLPLDEWLSHRRVLKRFFYDGWKHKRIEAELRRATDKIAKAREHGQKGGQVASMNREKNRYLLQRFK
jgi:uncharacterized protein YdaU (DUF1376 family)